MKQVRKLGISEFLSRRRSRVEERKACARSMGVSFCDECEDWPCDLLKRPVLAPMDLKLFERLMGARGALAEQSYEVYPTFPACRSIMEVACHASSLSSSP